MQWYESFGGCLQAEASVNQESMPAHAAMLMVFEPLWTSTVQDVSLRRCETAV